MYKKCNRIVECSVNLQKLFFDGRNDKAFSFRLSPFFLNLKKNQANANEMRVAGRNRIFLPLSIVKTANWKRKFHLK